VLAESADFAVILLMVGLASFGWAIDTIGVFNALRRVSPPPAQTRRWFSSALP
jgi:hypothetical protein